MSVCHTHTHRLAESRGMMSHLTIWVFPLFSRPLRLTGSTGWALTWPAVGLTIDSLYFKESYKCFFSSKKNKIECTLTVQYNKDGSGLLSSPLDKLTWHLYAERFIVCSYCCFCPYWPRTDPPIGDFTAQDRGPQSSHWNKALTVRVTRSCWIFSALSVMCRFITCVWSWQQSYTWLPE